jgi:hypothetical protein
MEEDHFDIQNEKCVLRLQNVDVFALGLVLYEILVGTPVFAPDLSAAEGRRKSQSRDRPPIPGSIRREFVQVIDRCWDADRSKRPTVGEIWHIMEAINFEILQGVDNRAVTTRIATWTEAIGHHHRKWKPQEAF